MKKIITIIFISFYLIGCSSIAEIKTIKETKNIVVTPTDDLIEKCEVPNSINKAEYISSNNDKKEKILTNNIIDLYTSITKCNEQISSLRKWFDEQKKIFGN